MCIFYFGKVTGIVKVFLGFFLQLDQVKDKIRISMNAH